MKGDLLPNSILGHLSAIDSLQCEVIRSELDGSSGSLDNMDHSGQELAVTAVYRGVGLEYDS